MKISLVSSLTIKGNGQNLLLKFGLLGTMLLPKVFNSNPYCSFSSSNGSSKTRCLQTLLKSGFNPTLKSINHFLRFLYQNQRFSYVVHLFSQMNSNQIKGNSLTHLILTWALLKSHNYDDAEQMLKTQILNYSSFLRNRLWNLLIQGVCVSRNDPEKALLVLRDCLINHGTLPSSFTFIVLIQKFSSQGKMDKAIELLELMSDQNVRYPIDNFVCSSIVSGFCKIGKPEFALDFFENAKASGNLRPNLVTYTALITALLKLRKFNEVSDLVNKMETENLAFDVVFYSCWMCGYIAEGLLINVFKKNREMIEKGIKPDRISYTILIYDLYKLGNVEKAFGVLENMKKSGIEPSLVTYTVIMLGLCKKGKLEEAFSLFKLVKDLEVGVDEFMYATLIDGCCRERNLDRVFDLLEEMEKRGLKPSIVTYNTVINGLCKMGRTSEADRISKGINGDVITYSTLLHGYIQEQNIIEILETKKRIEDSGVSLDVGMCNVLIKALFMVGAFEDAYILYQKMAEMGLIADSVTYCTLINGYCNIGRINEAVEIFDEFKSASTCSVAVYNCFIKALCRNGLEERAYEVFIELNFKGSASDLCVYKMLMRTIFKEKGAEGVCEALYGMEKLDRDLYGVLCNESICFLCQKGFHEMGSEIYSRMRRIGLLIEKKTYFLLIKAITKDGEMRLSQLILTNFLKEFGLVEPRINKIFLHFQCVKSTLSNSEEMEEKFSTIMEPDTVFKVLIKEGRYSDAYKLVMKAGNHLSFPDVFDYSILIDGLCKGGQIIEALDICVFAETNGIKLNIVSYNSVLNGLCRQSRLIEAFRLFDSLERIGLIPTEITYGTLIDSLCREGYLGDANKLFEKMISKDLKPNTHIYNSLIDGYIRIGKIEEAFKFLHESEPEFFNPDEFSVSSAINAFCQKGDMEGALGIFSEFRNKEISPDFLGFLYLIRGLCAKGRMEEARNILREMLNSQSVMELIKKVDTEIESEPIGSVVAHLCEEGRILEAYAVLNEVGSIFFSPQRRSLDYNQSHKLHSNNNWENIEYENLEKRPRFQDFNSYYSLLSYFCLEGDVQKASQLAKQVLSNLDRG